MKGVINKETSLDDSYLFEQYKIYVDMANDVSNRRESTNKFYISIISAMFGVICYTFTYTINSYRFINIHHNSVYKLALSYK